MNIRYTKYYEVWFYKKEENTGRIDYNYKFSELIRSDKALNAKEEIIEFFKKENKENIIGSIISWSEMCYEEFMEWTSVTLCCNN